MEKKVPLFYGETPVGFVTVEESGSRTVLKAESYIVGDEIIRAYVRDEMCSEALLIGVMEPVDGILRAKRTYTRNDLFKANLSAEKIIAGEMQCAETVYFAVEWDSCSSPEELFFDRALQESLRGVEGI